MAHRRSRRTRRNPKRSGGKSHPVWAGIGTYLGAGLLGSLVGLAIGNPSKGVNVLVHGVIAPAAAYGAGHFLFSKGAQTGVLAGSIVAAVVHGGAAAAFEPEQLPVGVSPAPQVGG
jgi:hypothetical protein